MDERTYKKLFLLTLSILCVSLVWNILQISSSQAKVAMAYQEGKLDGQNQARNLRFDNWDAWANYETFPKTTNGTGIFIYGKEHYVDRGK